MTGLSLVSVNAEDVILIKVVFNEAASSGVDFMYSVSALLSVNLRIVASLVDFIPPVRVRLYSLSGPLSIVICVGSRELALTVSLK